MHSADARDSCLHMCKVVCFSLKVPWPKSPGAQGRVEERASCPTPGLGPFLEGDPHSHLCFCPPLLAHLSQCFPFTFTQPTPHPSPWVLARFAAIVVAGMGSGCPSSRREEGVISTYANEDDETVVKNSSVTEE